MTTILFTVGLMATAMALMAVGVMMGRPELKGSCGGVGGAGCQCSSPSESCERRIEAEKAASEPQLYQMEGPFASRDAEAGSSHGVSSVS